MNECNNCRYGDRDITSWHCRRCYEDAFVNGVGFTGWKEMKNNDESLQWYARFGKKLARCRNIVSSIENGQTLHL